MCDQARGWSLVFALYHAMSRGEDRLGFHSEFSNDNVDAETFTFMLRIAEALLRRRRSRVRRGRKRARARA
jgi:hypothetical protein